MDSEILQIKIDGECEGDLKNQKLSLDNFDISEFKELLEHICNLVLPVNKEKQLITYSLKSGSIVNEISAPTNVIEALNKSFYSVNENRSLKDLDEKQAQALAFFQKMSSEKKRAISIKNTLDKNIELRIDCHTNYKIQKEKYIETDMILYGIITYMGGKQNPSIHLDTDEYGLVTIYTQEYVLKQIKNNLLYKEIGVEVSAKQSINTFKLKDVCFKKFIEYSQKYDKDRIYSLFEKGKESWKDISNVNEFLSEIRG